MKALLLAVLLTAAPLLRSPATWTEFRLNGSSNPVVAGTLSVRWTLPTGGGYSSSPALAGGTLFAANNDGRLIAIDPRSGKIRWTFRAYNALMAGPLVYRGLVIESEGDARTGMGTPAHPVRVGMGASAIFALDAKSGALRWRQIMPGSGMASSAIISRIVVHHDGAGYIAAYDPLDGRTLYVVNLGSFASMSAAVPVGAGSYVSEGGLTNAVWDIDASDSTVHWKRAFSARDGGLGDCPPAYSHGTVYCNYLQSRGDAVHSKPRDPVTMRAFALDARTGAIRWDVALERGPLVKRNEAAIPLAAEYAVYEGSGVAPFMHALDARTGRLLWRTQTHAVVNGGMVDVGGTLYFGDRAGYIYALNATTGRIESERHLPGRFNVSSPLVAGRTFIICNANGTIFAIPLKDI